METPVINIPMLVAAADAAGHDMLVTAVTAIGVGTLLAVFARRINVPGIVLLLIGGVLMGPEALGVVKPDSLGDGLLVVVELAIGLILFEGGLTLERQGYRSAPTMIKRLLTLGPLITGVATAVIVRLILRVPWDKAIIAASLVIVTGPTVIAPLLKRIRVTDRLHSILHWESVLIDPIGVFIAVLCFEWLGDDGGLTAFGNLGLRVGAGMLLGLGGGLIASAAIRLQIVPRDMVNIFALACAVLIFGIAEVIISKAGLLAVTIAGFVVGLGATSALRQIRTFKAEMTDLLIGTVFLLLAARLNLDQFATFGLAGAVVVALVMVLVRPLSIFACASGLGIDRREKLFLSWVAPRGIVAASLASLIAISLEARGEADPRFVETFTYSVIVATIILQGLTAAPLARLLGVNQEEPTGWLIVGAHGFAQQIAGFIRRMGDTTVHLVDTNAREVRDATRRGLSAIQADARETDLTERFGLHNVGNMLALTDNEDLNVRLCEAWERALGPDHVFRCNPTGAHIDTHEGGESTGRVLWPSLPRPTLVAAELERGEAALIETSPGAPLNPRGQLLAAFDGTTMQVGKEAADDGAHRLSILRRADYLLRAVRPDLIFDVDRTELRPLLSRLVDMVVDLHPQLPRDATVAELMEREAAFPSVIGHGVAVPHAYSRGLSQRFCVIARVAEGVAFPAETPEPVRLVFLLLSPQGDPEGHLGTLAEIARLCSSERMRERLITARSAQAVIHLVRRIETRED